MDSTNLLGLVAGVLTTMSFVPQVIKTWRTRSTHDLSLWMFSLFSVGVLLWVIYGVAIGSWPVIVANLVTLALSLAILYWKLRFR